MARGEEIRAEEADGEDAPVVRTWERVDFPEGGEFASVADGTFAGDAASWARRISGEGFDAVCLGDGNKDGAGPGVL